MSVRTEKIRALTQQLFRTSLMMLREIFDEAAYERFLDRAGMVSSSRSYEMFRREFEEAKMRRPKCC